MSTNFKDIMSKRTDEEVIKIVTVDRGYYQPLAVVAAEEEIKSRKIDPVIFNQKFWEEYWKIAEDYENLLKKHEILFNKIEVSSNIEPYKKAKVKNMYYKGCSTIGHHHWGSPVDFYIENGQIIDNDYLKVCNKYKEHCRCDNNNCEKIKGNHEYFDLLDEYKESKNYIFYADNLIKEGKRRGVRK